MPELRTPREAWIAEGLKALADGGVDAVRVERLARGLGVTKGGFYGHFPDRGALLEELVDAWEHTLVAEPVATVEAAAGDGRARLEHLFALARTSAQNMMSVELAVRDWARHDAQVAERVCRVDDRRMAFMRKLFGDFCDDADDVEARCLLAFSLFIGNHFIAAHHGHRSRADVVDVALGRLLR